MESIKKVISTIDGDVVCVDRFDADRGNIICLYDDNNNYIGEINGSVMDYTEDELYEIVASNIRI